MSPALPAALDSQQIPNDVGSLKHLLLTRDAAYREVFTAWQSQFESLHQQILNLRRIQFGASSERLAGQAELFSEPVTLPLPPTLTEKITYERQRPGRPALPKDLPRERVEYDLAEAEKAEFDVLTRIGEEVSETLDYTPAKLIVIEHARLKYACEKDGERTIRTAAAQPSPLPKSNASPGLLAQVIVAKYCDHVPLNRQEKIFKRHGCAIAKATLCEWSLATAALVDVLLPPLIEHVLAAPRVHCDDTVLPLQVAGRGKTKMARLWGYLGAGERRDETGVWVHHPPAVVFEFTQSRESIHPLRFLAHYRGYLQADAYSGFDVLYRSGDIIEVGCIVHLRRKFFEVAQPQKTPGLAHEALAFIAKLYEIEAAVRGQSPDEKYLKRQSEAVPLLTDFKAWLEGHYGKLLPRGPLAQAFYYALAHWDALVRYTEHGVLEPDNNWIERALRPVAVGRHAWLFAGSERGGRAAATFYSLIETAKLNGVEPFAYLKDVLTRLPSHPINRVAELLPFHWKAAHASDRSYIPVTENHARA